VGPGVSGVVAVAPGTRPAVGTVVRVGDFEGPLGLLLDLIEQRELDVRTVPLGDLAGGYLEAIAGLPGDRMPHLSAFLSVAALLILIKSRAILPEAATAEPELPPDEPDPAEELRQRLIAYRTFRDAAARLGARLESDGRLVHREAGVADLQLDVPPAPGEPTLDPTLLVEALAGLVRVAPPPQPAPETLRRLVTLEERAALIRAALARAPLVVLQDLLQGATDRVVVAVTFLAMLELNKRRELVVEQEVPWGPIICRRPEAAA
jgi:segregation and condensation protein A